jgi:hypothetical protein
VYKSPGIPAKPVQAGRETLCFEILKFINSIWNEEEFPEQRKELLLCQFT